MADELGSGFAKRPVPGNEYASMALKNRTLTNLYNTRSQRLADAHSTFVAPVPTAYGWDTDVLEDDALTELLALNPADGSN